MSRKKTKRTVSRKIRPLPAEAVKDPNKTLLQICEWAEMSQKDILSLFNDHMVLNHKVSIGTKFNIKLAKEVDNEKVRLDKLMMETGIEQRRIYVEGKELRVKEIELDKVLDPHNSNLKQEKVNAVAAAFDFLNIKEENTGNAQMINTYLAKNFKEFMKAQYGIDTEPMDKPDIVVPDKKIILPGDKDFVEPGK